MQSASASAPPTSSTTTATQNGAMHAWEDTGTSHVWESVQEDAEGNIVVDRQETIEEQIRRYRKQYEKTDYAQRHRRVVRDMIRYVYVVVDCSRWMRVKDPVFGTTARRLDAVAQILKDFVREYYDQNPVSHLGLVIAQDGEAELLTQLSGSSKTHTLALTSLVEACANEGPAAGGEFSLQNALETAGRSLGHQPRHGSREIVILTAALSTCDPGSIITDTLPKLLAAKIRVSCLALSAELHICRKLTELTHGVMGVCLDAQHCRDWLWQQCTPPPRSKDLENSCEMILMGFPTRTIAETAELVHAASSKILLSRTAFTCPQCLSKNSELPTDCAVCGLKLVLAPHLARSFHHLFPVPAFLEVTPNMQQQQQQQTTSSTSPTSRLPPAVSSTTTSQQPIIASSSSKSSKSKPTVIPVLDDKLFVSSQDNPHPEKEDHSSCCFACLRPLRRGTLKFQCPVCQNCVCVDCDTYLHESLHNCPGCLSQPITMNPR